MNKITSMLSPHLRKFSDLYVAYGLSAVKYIRLINCLIPLARTANLYKMKDYIGGPLHKDNTQPSSRYKRPVRFFQVWGGKTEVLNALLRLS